MQSSETKSPSTSSKRPLKTADGQSNLSSKRPAKHRKADSSMIRSSDIKILFEKASESIDEHHDQRERIIKMGRDITRESKKLIVTMHRWSPQNSDKVFDEATKQRKEIIEMFKTASGELQGPNFYRYFKPISMSFQEYIEAITFMEYVRSQRILTIHQCQKDFIDDEGHQFLPLTKEDYLLGVADLTGELMRFSINSITKGFQEKAMEICQVLRDLYADFQIIHASYHVPELGKKLGVMKSSLMKVENVCYSYAIRRGEYPDEMINDMMLVNRGGNEEYEQNNDYEQRDE